MLHLLHLIIHHLSMFPFSQNIYVYVLQILMNPLHPQRQFFDSERFLSRSKWHSQPLYWFLYWKLYVVLFEERHTRGLVIFASISQVSVWDVTWTPYFQWPWRVSLRLGKLRSSRLSQNHWNQIHEYLLCGLRVLFTIAHFPTEKFLSVLVR